jgi:hypothetical protein
MRFLLLLVVFLCGCTKELTEESVRMFVESADQAFLEGHARDVCDMRSDGFRLEATEFSLTKTIVADLAEAEAVAATQQQRNGLFEGQRVKLGKKEFCQMAFEARTFYQRASMKRTDLQITIAPDKSHADVHAHYTIWEPVYDYAESSLGLRDEREIQKATKQTEAVDASVVVLENGELRFATTKSVSKSFYVAKHRDTRL